MGGGAPIIEPSSEDIIIPAFTNVDLTVKDVELSRFGIVSGSFTPTENTKDISLSFDLPSAPTIVLVWHEEPAPLKTTNTMLRRAVFFNHPNTEAGASTLHSLARAESGTTVGSPRYYEGYLYGTPVFNNQHFTFQVNYLYYNSISSAYVEPIIKAGIEYKWIALCV